MLCIYIREEEKLVLISTKWQQSNGSVIGIYPATNNADSTSKGPWPPGVYPVEDLVVITGQEGEEYGKYGRYFLGFKEFEQEDGQVRRGMGIHAGRQGKSDLAGRTGFRHATLGCIRTTDEAMKLISDLWPIDKIDMMWVK